MVLVTVLMGSYNHEKYIGDAIKSVLNQTFQDFELIITDDGSTDHSREIIEQYQAKDSRVKAFFHKENWGIAKTANEGLMKAKGNYVCFIGSDDFWFHCKLAKQVQLIKNHEDKIIWSEGEIIDNHGVPTGQVMTKLLCSPKKKSGDLFQELLREDYIFGQSVMLKTHFAKEVTFNENLRYVNDHLFFVNLSKKHEFVFIPQPLAKYRLHGDNTTLKNPKVWFEERIVLRRYFLEKFGSEISAGSLSDIYYKMGHAFAGLGQIELAKYFYIKAIRVNPFRSKSALYLILALTNGKGFVGKSLEDLYQRLAVIFV